VRIVSRRTFIHNLLFNRLHLKKVDAINKFKISSFRHDTLNFNVSYVFYLCIWAEMDSLNVCRVPHEEYCKLNKNLGCEVLNRPHLFSVPFWNFKVLLCPLCYL
jgi:hypothetical protein